MCRKGLVCKAWGMQCRASNLRVIRAEREVIELHLHPEWATFSAPDLAVSKSVYTPNPMQKVPGPRRKLHGNVLHPLRKQIVSRCGTKPAL
jgi:hypothetical protein